MKIGNMFDSWRQKGFGASWIEGLLLLVKVICAVIPIILLIGIANAIVQSVFGISANILSDADNSRAAVSFMTIVGSFIGSFLNILLISFLAMIEAAGGMTYRDKGSVTFGDMWYVFSAPNKGTIILAFFLRSLLTSVGTLCCILPGIFIAVATVWLPYVLLVKPELTAVEAIKYSIRLFLNNIGIWFTAFLDILLMYLISMLCCCSPVFMPLTYPFLFKRMAEAFIDSYIADNR